MIINLFHLVRMRIQEAMRLYKFQREVNTVLNRERAMIQRALDQATKEFLK